MKIIIFILMLLISNKVYALEVPEKIIVSDDIKNLFDVKNNNIDFEDIDENVILSLTNKSITIVDSLFNVKEEKEKTRLNIIKELSDNSNITKITETFNKINKKTVNPNLFTKYQVYKIKDYYLVSIENEKNSVDLIFNKKQKLIRVDTTLINDNQINNIFGASNNISDNSLIINKYKDIIVSLKTFDDKSVIEQSLGFYIADGIVATSWKYISASIKNGSVISLNYKGISEEVKNIISVNPELDMVLLKVNKTGKFASFGEITSKVYIVKEDEKDYKVIDGIVLDDKNTIITNIANISNSSSEPLFNEKGEVVGILNKNNNSNYSSYSSSKYIIELLNELNNTNYDEIKTKSINKVKNSIYSLNTKIIKNLQLSESKYEQVSLIGNIKNNIDFELVKSIESNNGVVTLRFLNKYSSMISSISKMSKFRLALKDSGYKEIESSSTRFVYKSKTKTITAFESFNYLTIIIEEV